MKISELNTNTFLNNSGSPENSYLLINYASAQGAAPTTQKVSLETVSNAVAAKLNLPIAVTDNQGNVTGLQHVVATGNQYQIENLNAQFGGGGSSEAGGGSTAIGVDPITAVLQKESGNVEVNAYPVFFIPKNQGEFTAETTIWNASGNGTLAVLTESNGTFYVSAYNDTESEAIAVPSMGGGGGGNASGAS